MDTDDSNNIFILTEHADFAVIHIIFLEVLNISYEVEKSHITGLLVSDRLLGQHAQIGRALRSSRKRRSIVKISGLRENIPNQFVNWCV